MIKEIKNWYKKCKDTEQIHQRKTHIKMQKKANFLNDNFMKDKFCPFVKEECLKEKCVAFAPAKVIYNEYLKECKIVRASCKLLRG